VLAPQKPPSASLTRLDGTTCDDCYFRQAALCALSPDRPCPTFRLFSGTSFAPPPEPRFVPELARVVAQYATAG